ncbi:MAG: thioesterase family protein [Bacteroidia bacterium]
MKNLFKPGDKKKFSKVVKESDTAAFESGEVHPVYSTFAICRDAEWAGRLFVLEMKEVDEEGIGTFLHIDHRAPAMVGSKVEFTATLKNITANSVVCSFEAKVRDKIIASGETGQKILKKEKLKSLFVDLKS